MSDPYWDDVTLLVSFDEGAGLTTTTNKKNGDTLTIATGALSDGLGGPKFGPSFASGHILSPYTMPRAIGTDDFTLEWWAWENSTSGTAIFISIGNGTDELSLVRYAGQTQNVIQVNGANTILAGNNFVTSAWRHQAVERVGGTLTFYDEGVATGTPVANSSSFGDLFNMSVNSTYDNWRGVDEVRLTIGTARYQGNFTPPTAPFPTEGPNLWTPDPSDPTLLAWLDADDAATVTTSGSDVTEWADKSDSGNNANNTAAGFYPQYGSSTLNGLSTVSFNNDRLNWTPVGNITYKAAFFVTNSLAGSSASASIAPLLGYSPANNDHVFVRTNDLAYSISIDGALSRTGNASVSGNATVAGGNIDLGVTNAQEEAGLQWYFDQDSNDVLTNKLGQMDTASFTYYLIGDMAEVILLSDVPSLADRQRYEGYLAWKWGLEANLPVGHPYKNAPPESTTPPVGGPVIDVQPQSQTITQGDLATFNIAATASAGALSYQWKEDGAPVGTDQDSYTRPWVLADSGTVITCDVTDDNGTTVSDPATLTVNAVPLVITQQPQDTTVDEFSPVTFTVTATGWAPLSYQWKKNGLNVGTDSAVYTFTPIYPDDDGAAIAVDITDGNGVTVTSDGALLTVIEYIYPTWTTELPRRGPIYKGGNLILSEVSTGKVRLLRKTPIVNPFSATPSQPFDTEAFEYMLDVATMIQQEIEGHACACPEFPLTDGGGELEIDPIVNPEPECFPYSCAAFDDWPYADPSISHIDVTREVTGAPTIPLKIGRWTPYAAGGSWITYNKQMSRDVTNDAELDTPKWCEQTEGVVPLSLALLANPASPAVRGYLDQPEIVNTLSFHWAGTVRSQGGQIVLQFADETKTYRFDVTFGLLGSVLGDVNYIAANSDIRGARLSGDESTWRYVNASVTLSTVPAATQGKFRVRAIASLTMTGYESITNDSLYDGEWSAEQLPTQRIYCRIQAATNIRMDVADLIDSDLVISTDGEAYFNRKFPNYEIPEYCVYTGDEI